MKPFQDEGVWLVVVESSVAMVGCRWTLLRCLLR